MKVNNLLDKLKNNELKTGTIIEVFKDNLHVFNMMYNGIDLLYDYDVCGTEWLYNTRYDFFKQKRITLLDDIERKYLRKVIEPYNVLQIRKLTAKDYRYQCISITIRHEENDSYTIVLPPFKRNSMYKNMEVGRFYTLAELEL